MIVLGIIFMVFVAPLWILTSYWAKIKNNQNLSFEDEKLIEDLWKMTRKMEDRIVTLETILDKEYGQRANSSHKGKENETRP